MPDEPKKETEPGVVWASEEATALGPAAPLERRPIPLPAPRQEGSSRVEEAVDQEADRGLDSAASAPTAAPAATADRDGDDEPFDVPGVEQVGIVGGRQAGKSYLFQAMVYRTYAGQQSGALTYYLKGIRLFSALKRSDPARTVYVSEFVRNYSAWQRLGSTLWDVQRWYRLRMRYRTGILGRSESNLDVELFDGSGEGFFEAPRSAATRELWKQGYSEARTMIFCLPLWAAFPGAGLKDADWDERARLLEGFDRVVQNFTDVRGRGGRRHPVRTILALTQADDRRTALKTLQDRWIQPYMDSPHTYLRQLRRGSGVGQYLANARTVSLALHEEFDTVRDPKVASIPGSLEFGGGKPWLIPVSAIEGAQLDAQQGKASSGGRPLNPPVPVHVELPLLVALCERHNALM